MSDFNNFLFNENDWYASAPEHNGMLDKVWLTSKNNKNMRALFKQDVIDKNARMIIPAKSEREYASAQIAEQLGIPHARIEIVEYNGKIGTLSFDAHSKEKDAFGNFRYNYYNMDEFAQMHGLINENSDYVLSRISGISLQTIKQKYLHLEKDTVNMLFLDCLIQNYDRHKGNWEFKCNAKGEPLEICAIFDFDRALEPELLYGKIDKKYSIHNRCSVLYADNIGIVEKQSVMFARLANDYPKQIKILLNKANAIPNLPKIAAKQLKIMNMIYLKSKLWRPQIMRKIK